MKQPAPDVTEADVKRVLLRDFEPNDVAQIEAQLRECDPALSPRAILAALKLSDCVFESVSGNLAQARLDWRDVIAYAEYPSYMQKVPGAGALTDEQLEDVYRADWAQYQAWLGR